MDKYKVLSDCFGYTSFREGQESVIDALLMKKDVLGIMPTGAGKSICFQVPALMFGGVTIVVSPLISLMKDQVNSLVQNGIKAAYINASLSEKQISLALSRMERGFYKIIYVAPERLETRAFLSAVNKLDVSMVCVDEAHCVSQWGKDFRPSYLVIEKFIYTLPKRPVVCAMTATATSRVRDDIVKLIGLRNPLIEVLSFDRKNLSFSCVKPKSKPKELRRLLDFYSGKSGIVYCSSRKRVDKLYDDLSAEGYSVAKYHAGMANEERKRNQELFITDEKAVIIATNAFGMGIDKSNVSFVIHYNMPSDIESYYQEAGRAGRDGNAADCILLYNNSDIRTQMYFIENPDDNSQLSEAERERMKKLRVQRLWQMFDYTKGEQCLRQYMLSYFGESSPNNCGNCSVCNKSKDGYVRAELSEVVPAKEKTVKHNKTKQEMFDAEFDENLFEALRALRKRIADEQKVPAFVVFTDATLVQMSKLKPKTEDEFLMISGVGLNKLSRYGAIFLKEIISYLYRNGNR